MTKLATEYEALNLSQGFSVFEVSQELIKLVNHYMKKGYNQYAPMTGIPILREQISKKVYNYFENMLLNSRFEIIPSFGTYFQVLDYSKISNEDDMSFAAKLIKEYGIASIPLSPFYSQPVDLKMLRFVLRRKKKHLKRLQRYYARSISNYYSIKYHNRRSCKKQGEFRK